MRIKPIKEKFTVWNRSGADTGFYREFLEKIRAGKHAQRTKDFMIIARIESLILEKGMEDALMRAFAYVQAGADGIMIHSRKKTQMKSLSFVTNSVQKIQLHRLLLFQLLIMQLMKANCGRMELTL